MNTTAGNTSTNPNHLHLLKQKHIVKGIEYTPAVLEKVIASQQKMLDTLLELRTNYGLKHIFCEGLSEDFKSKAEDPARDNVRSIFEGYSPGQTLSALQRNFFKQLGADIAFFYLHDDVTLYATQSEQDEKFRNSYFEANCERIAQTKQFNEKDKEVILTSREEDAVERINHFFARNHGEHVALIFGARHDFSKYYNNMDPSLPQFHEHDCTRKEHAAPPQVGPLAAPRQPRVIPANPPSSSSTQVPLQSYPPSAPGAASQRMYSSTGPSIPTPTLAPGQDDFNPYSLPGAHMENVSLSDPPITRKERLHTMQAQGLVQSDAEAAQERRQARGGRCLSSDCCVTS